MLRNPALVIKDAGPRSISGDVPGEAFSAGVLQTRRWIIFARRRKQPAGRHERLLRLFAHRLRCLQLQHVAEFDGGGGESMQSEVAPRGDDLTTIFQEIRELLFQPVILDLIRLMLQGLDVILRECRHTGRIDGRADHERGGVEVCEMKEHVGDQQIDVPWFAENLDISHRPNLTQDGNLHVRRQQDHGTVPAVFTNHPDHAQGVFVRLVQSIEEEIDGLRLDLIQRFTRGGRGYDVQLELIQLQFEKKAIRFIGFAEKNAAGDGRHFIRQILLCVIDIVTRAHDRLDIDFLVKLDAELMTRAGQVTALMHFAVDHHGTALLAAQHHATPGARMHVSAVQHTHSFAGDIATVYVIAALPAIGVLDAERDVGDTINKALRRSIRLGLAALSGRFH